MAVFGHGSGLVTELPTLAVLMAHFGHYIANFDGVPSELPPGGSSDGTFLTVVELQTLAVLMALFSHAISWSPNCQPWQFWWHISATTQSVHRTANLGSFYGTSQSILVSCQQTSLCHIWLCSGWNVPLELPRSAVYWPNQYYGRNVPPELPRLAVYWPRDRMAEKCHQNCQGLQFYDG